MVENIVGIGENAGYQHFSFFCNVFKNVFLRAVKTSNCLVKGFRIPFLTLYHTTPERESF